MVKKKKKVSLLMLHNQFYLIMINKHNNENTIQKTLFFYLNFFI
jgi:hypothetical protein